MKKILLFVVFLLIQRATANAQVFEGTVKDAQTNENLAYVNIGVIGRSSGTVTDDNGHFKLVLNNSNTDSLRISMIGYMPKTYSVSDFITHYSPGETIILVPALHQLAEVKISGRKSKLAVLGNTTRSKSTNAGFTSNKLGYEIGEIIKIKRAPTLLKQFNASLAYSIPDSIKLRLNFYSVKNGLPDKILQQQNIFVTVKKGDEQITVDLTPYNIVVNDKFFVSLEWIKDSKGPGLMFSASMFSSAMISRETSQAAWEKEGLAGLGFNVLVSY